MSCKNVRFYVSPNASAVRELISHPQIIEARLQFSEPFLELFTSHIFNDRYLEHLRVDACTLYSILLEIGIQ